MRPRLITSSIPKRAFSSSRRVDDVGGKIRVINSIKSLREWRNDKREKKLSVGVVPTMGALHQGHLDLVKASLSRNPYTVMTLFVNPMQFAPTEDLSKYPRTLQKDLELLETLLPPTLPSSSSNQTPRTHPSTQLPTSSYPPSSDPQSSTPSPLDQESESISHPLIVFAPPTDEMYPLRGELQDLDLHRGVGVEMRGWGDVMEGQSRPQFFKGVATVCTKLFNAVEPDHAYFGQKDIQQALLLKMMVSDLLLSHPSSENLHILPTTRDPETNLALSSRNVYLSPSEHKIAPILFKALSRASDEYEKGGATGEQLVSAAISHIQNEQRRIEDDGENVELRLDYIEVFDKSTFEPVRGGIESGKELVIAGAIWVGSTRLIDNLLLGWEVD